MLTVRFITIGTLKEAYLKDAVSEYQKRLSGFCKIEEVNLKEARLSDRPAESEIKSALEAEGKAILDAIPPRAYAVALCVEGQQFSSPELADQLSHVMHQNGALTLVIGSSHGLSARVKSAADLRLSVSKLTFPHQMMRVLLLETVYRSLSILHGTKYHK